MKILVIIPAYNEEANILNTVKSVLKYNKKYKTNYDIIVINDGSKDQTGQICKNNQIPVIDLIQNLGIGGAVQTGYKYAKNHNYDIAIQFDGDGQHDVTYIKDIIQPIIDNKADMTVGSRFIKKTSNNFYSTTMRRLGINVISFVIKLVTHKKIYDTTSGFRACNKEVINIFANDYPIEYPEPISTVDLLKQNYSVEEVPVLMKERVAGKSSITPFKSAYYMINVILAIIIRGSK